MRNITDYLIEEASAEEEELLGQVAETEENDEKDQSLVKVFTFVFISYISMSKKYHRTYLLHMWCACMGVLYSIQD